jgi:hypothetical protein
VAGGWRRLHNEELHKLYASPNIIRVIKSAKIRWVGNVASIGNMINSYYILGGKHEEKRQLGKPSRRWEDNIKIDLGEIVWGGAVNASVS